MILLMNKPIEIMLIEKFSSSLIKDFVQTILEPKTSSDWLQGLVNILNQILGSNNLILYSFVDNVFISSAKDEAFNDFNNYAAGNNGFSAKPVWIENKYVVPLSSEGILRVVWDKKPSDNELKQYNNIFLLLNNALKNRTEKILQENKHLFQEVIFSVGKILGNNDSLHDQISKAAKEIGLALNVSRCQIKVFSELNNLIYDSSLSSEFLKDGFLESISVISKPETDWLKNNDTEFLIYNKSSAVKSDLSDIDLLLSIQSALGCPIIYKGNIVATLVLHQCNYERSWKEEEISFLKEIALLIGLSIGKEFDFIKKYSSLIKDQNTGFMNSDEFLRTLTEESNKVFSLIMIDIDKLKDINLKMGFVAGNLVLSQTARYLKRFFGEKCKIARYSNDEFIVILEGADHNKARLEAEKLKSELSNISVLGVGPVDYSFSFTTFPTDTSSISELLTVLEQAMLLSKARGKSQISSFNEIREKEDIGTNKKTKEKWHEMLHRALPEIIIKKSSLKTGPEIIKTINKQILEHKEKKSYSADILDSIQSLALALDAKDSYTEGHSKKVSEYAFILAKQINLDLQEIEWIRLAAVMHDIGKIGIPESILCKPSKLTKEEFDVMKKHPVIGARILKPIKPLEKVANLVLSHHEYWDGSGYPNGIEKTNIPIGSRIVSIVDAFQAMTSTRPYRSSLPFEEAISRLKEGKEKQWDPDLVEMFIKIVS